MPMITVVLPCYNVEMYVDKCLDSLLCAYEKCKTVYADFFLEVIAVDDGATDKTGLICDQYASKFPDIIRVVHQANTGLGGARNVGLSGCKGVYVAFVDSDDAVSEEYFVKLFDVIQTNHPDAICFGFKSVTSQGELVTSRDLCAKKLIEVDASSARAVWSHIGNAFAWNVCLKRSVIAATRFENITPGEDVLFTTEVMKSVKNFVVLENVLYKYLQRSGSLMHKRSISSKQIASATYSTRRRIELLADWPFRQYVGVSVHKMLSNTYIGLIGTLLEGVSERDVTKAWDIYVSEGVRAYSVENVTGGYSYLWQRLIFSTRSKIFWRIGLFLPWIIKCKIAQFIKIGGC